MENREVLEEELRKKGVEIHTDVHASGHGSRDDLKELIDIIKPETVIPAHGGLDKEEELAVAATELGYKVDENVFILKNGDTIDIE
jgi:ribonuclease J